MVDDQGHVESGDGDSQTEGDEQNVQPSDDTVIKDDGQQPPEDTNESAADDDEQDVGLDTVEDDDDDDDEEMFTMEVPEDFSVDNDQDEFD